MCLFGDSIGRRRHWFPLVLLMMFIPLTAGADEPAAAGSTGTLTGRVVGLEGQSVTDAQVMLPELNRLVTVNEEAAYRLEDLPVGRYVLEATSVSGGRGNTEAEVLAGQVVHADIVLDIHGFHTFHQTVVVSASVDPRQQEDVAQATTVLAGEELALRAQPTLGETLAQEPGVSSTSFAPGASRPVIRGFTGERVRILQNGLGTGDVSQTGDDHAVAVDPLTAEQIEVIRGPATLLYGGAAVGGVVNVVDNTIPQYRFDDVFIGRAELNLGSAADERSGAVNLEGSSGDWAWHVDALVRQTDDYEIPGYAEAGHEEHDDQDDGDGHEEEEEAYGILENSDLETRKAAVGISRFFGDAGFVGISWSGYETEFGIPGHEHHGEEHEGEEEEEEEGHHGEEGVRSDLEQRRVDLHGAISRPFGWFDGARFKLGIFDYEHKELEGEEVGSVFQNDGWEGRLEFSQKRYGVLSGAFGLQLQSKDFDAAGEEAFIPPTQSDSWAVFAVEEIDLGAFDWQLGARYEALDHEALAEGVPDRDFSGISGSLGLIWNAGEAWGLAASLTRSAKLPAPSELYADGFHPAAGVYEVGDPDLEEETGLGADISLRLEQRRLHGVVNLFYNRIDDFIYPMFTGEELDGAPVVRYTQEDSEFWGGELRAGIELHEWGSRHFDLDLGADYVRAELRDTGEPLPRIPPLSFLAGLRYHDDRWRASLEVRRVDEQDRVAGEETVTAGYTMLNASLGYRFFMGKQVLDLLLRGRNLTDEEARNHLSYNKDVAPLPGRDISLSLRFLF